MVLYVTQTDVLTCSMGSLEAFLLHGVIREEADEHLVAGGYNRLRFLGATVSSEAGCLPIPTVVNLNVVISTFQMRLHVDFIESLK